MRSKPQRLAIPLMCAMLMGCMERGQSHSGVISRPSDKEKVCLLVVRFHGDVLNGGLDQFYWNSSGSRATDTVDALRRIGAHNTAQLLTQANAVFGEAGPSTSQGVRVAQLDSLPTSSIETLNSLTYEMLTSDEDLETLMAQFVGQHEGG
jgi:hypothetical protein